MNIPRTSLGSLTTVSAGVGSSWAPVFLLPLMSVCFPICSLMYISELENNGSPISRIATVSHLETTISIFLSSPLLRLHAFSQPPYYPSDLARFPNLPARQTPFPAFQHTNNQWNVHVTGLSVVLNGTHEHDEIVESIPAWAACMGALLRESPGKEGREVFIEASWEGVMPGRYGIVRYCEMRRGTQ